MLVKFFPAAVLQSGTLGSHEVRFYDTGGELLHRGGIRGSGPGEFQNVGWLDVAPADSVVAFDYALQRFTVFDQDHRYARTFDANATASGQTRPLGVFSSGLIGMLAVKTRDPRGKRGVVRDTFQFLRLARDGVLADTVGSLPGMEWVHFAGGGAFQQVQLPFLNKAFAAILGDKLIYARSESSSLAMLNMEGEVVDSIVLPIVPVPVSGQDVAREIRRFAEDDPEGGGEPLARALLDIEYPVYSQAISDLRVDSSGQVWVRLYTPSGSPEQHWMVFDQGRLVGGLSLSADFWILDITEEKLLVRAIDALAVESVRLYTIEP